MEDPKKGKIDLAEVAFYVCLFLLVLVVVADVIFHAIGIEYEIPSVLTGAVTVGLGWAFAKKRAGG